MKKFLSAILISGLMSMVCGVALAQQDQPKAERKAKTEAKGADTTQKTKTSEAKTKATAPDWWVKSGKAKTEEPKNQKTGDKAMNKTDKDSGSKTKAKTKK